MSTPATKPKHDLSPTELAKRRAAYKAVEDHFRPTARYVGIGSGSTVVFVVEAIASQGVHATSNTTFIPTGFQSRDLIIQAGLRLGAIDSLGDDPTKGDAPTMLDVSFDGADEVDADLNCIKGGGACLLQEKLVAISARKFVCVAAGSKFQPRLLTKYPSVPLEVIPLAAPTVLRALRRLGSTGPTVRAGGSAKAGPVVTDNGNFIIDAPFPHPLLIGAEEGAEGDGRDGKWRVETLANRLKGLVGVVETGLFCGLDGDEAQARAQTGAVVHAQKPVVAYFGTEDGEVIVRTAKGEERRISGAGGS